MRSYYGHQTCGYCGDVIEVVPAINRDDLIIDGHDDADGQPCLGAFDPANRIGEVVPLLIYPLDHADRLASIDEDGDLP